MNKIRQWAIDRLPEQKKQDLTLWFNAFITVCLSLLLVSGVVGVVLSIFRGGPFDILASAVAVFIVAMIVKYL